MSGKEWSQPMCGCCWQAYALGKFGDARHLATVLRSPPPEVCCTCGGKAEQGIYIRVDPDLVPFPRPKGPDG